MLLTVGKTLSLGVTTAVMMVSPWFKGKKWRTFRTCCFVGCGLSGIVPLVHGVRMFGWEQMNKQSGMPYYMIEGAFLLGGAFIYGVSVLEYKLLCSELMNM